MFFFGRIFALYFVLLCGFIFSSQQVAVVPQLQETMTLMPQKELIQCPHCNIVKPVVPCFDCTVRAAPSQSILYPLDAFNKDGSRRTMPFKMGFFKAEYDPEDPKGIKTTEQIIASVNHSDPKRQAEFPDQTFPAFHMFTLLAEQTVETAAKSNKSFELISFVYKEREQWFEFLKRCTQKRDNEEEIDKNALAFDGEPHAPHCDKQVLKTALDAMWKEQQQFAKSNAVAIRARILKETQTRIGQENKRIEELVDPLVHSTLGQAVHEVRTEEKRKQELGVKILEAAVRAQDKADKKAALRARAEARRRTPSTLHPDTARRSPRSPGRDSGTPLAGLVSIVATEHVVFKSLTIDPNASPRPITRNTGTGFSPAASSSASHAAQVTTPSAALSTGRSDSSAGSDSSKRSTGSSNDIKIILEGGHASEPPSARPTTKKPSTPLTTRWAIDSKKAAELRRGLPSLSIGRRLSVASEAVISLDTLDTADKSANAPSHNKKGLGMVLALAQNTDAHHNQVQRIHAVTENDQAQQPPAQQPPVRQSQGAADSGCNCSCTVQ